LLTLTEADPDFRFLMDGQTVVIDDYLEVRPQARERLERAVRSGQIQVGPWYTLPDEFLVSGETLIRDLQRGLASADLHGGSMRAGYLPDSFGHAAQMPQIYRQLGFRHAAVWRGVPLAIDRVAFDWEAPDGSRILTAYMGNSYSQGVDLPTEPDALAERIASALQAIAPFRPTADVLLMNGNDHVLPQAALSAAVRGAAGRLDGTTIRLARLDDYLARLPENGWPHWRGELRSSARANVLMGTLSVRVPDKQRYFEAIRLLERMAEPIAALTELDVADAFDQAWTLILQNAAHDTACGSGIDAVAEESRRRSTRVIEIAERIVQQALPQLAGTGAVWNPSPFPRQAVIDVDGRPLLTPVIPGCSSARLEAVDPGSPVTANRRRLENAYLAADLNPDGTITVLHKRTGARYSNLNRLVDEGDAGDEYNFSPPAEPDDPILTTPRGSVWNVVEAGPLRGRVEVRFDRCISRGLQDDRQRRSADPVGMPVRLVATLDVDSTRLDLQLEIENRASDHRLRAHFPLPFRASHSSADTAFHVTPRAVAAARRDPGAAELELPTYPAWSFVDVSDGHAGVALIAHGLHEYEVLPGPPQELALTLLRSVGWLSRDDLVTRIGHAGPEMETPGAQVLGGHRFRYSLFFHPGDWQEGGVWRAAESALLPLVAGKGAPVATPAPLIELEPECMQMTALRPRPGGYDLRFLNASDEAGDARLRLQPQPAAVTVVTLADVERERLTPNDGVLQIPVRPWEIVTLRASR
jgi:alpha-mannosidase